MPKGIPSIPKSVISRVMAEVGFPVVSFDDLGIKEQDAIDLFIYPAMQKYFAYNPNQFKTSHSLAANIKINLPFPSDATFGVLQARVAFGDQMASRKYNPLRDYQRRSMIGSSRGNIYDNPYYTKNVTIAEQSASRSYISLSRAGNMEIDRDNRMLRGFSNVAGELVVTWAQCSDKWSDIRFEHEADVVDMAKAHALRYFGMLRAQMDPNTGVQMNGDTFLSRADSIEERINERWQSKPKVVVMR